MAGVAEVTGQWNRVFEDLREEHAPRALEVTGRLPSGLVGSLYRVGPSCFSSNGHQYQTLFDGDGAVSRVRFDGKGAEGSVRFVEGSDQKEEVERGKALYSTFGTKSPSRLHRVGGRIKNGANTSLLSWQGKMFALFEGGFRRRFLLPIFGPSERIIWKGRCSNPFRPIPIMFPSDGRSTTMAFASAR